ncbi:MarR family winged helix-turn-helix transcriptional regulator [Kineococcus glutinatus]|uniref:MarR family winged helix-turn-helix transcriptional regulator n=1 Tax=Kineococcus glutinatus TaxID=1070872 RepID=UPI0031EC6FC9
MSTPSTEDRDARVPAADDPAGPPARTAGNPADAVVGLLQALTIESQRFAEVFADAHRLHPTDLSALAHISKAMQGGGALTAGELSRVLVLSTSATTALVDRLQRAGHVERVPDPLDRRRVRVQMTPSAQQLARAFFSRLGLRVRDLLLSYPERDLEFLQDVLGKVVGVARSAADEARADAPGPS